MRKSKIPYWWFGCTHCDIAWLGAFTAMTGKQMHNMFALNKQCPACHHETLSYPGLPEIPYTHNFGGSIAELRNALNPAERTAA